MDNPKTPKPRKVFFKIIELTLEDIREIQKIPNLVQLDLTDSNIFFIENYRKIIFQCIPQLQVVIKIF